MRRLIALLSLFILSFALTAQNAPQPQGELQGYTAESAQQERNWEGIFRKIPEPTRMRDAMQRLSARPHHVGSPYDKDNAEWLMNTFKSWGLDSRIENFYVLFPTPKERVVELLAPTHFVARLQEPPIPIDPTSNQQSEQLPTYNAYSVDGDVTGPLVYVNQGVPADYDELDRLGISVKGAIVIARYGGSWRGIKPKVAAEHGAIGCLIYSDPHEDGYFEGDVFPKGPYRPPDGVQRGSVADMPVYSGDPLTPGVGATDPNAKPDLSKAKTLTKIPVLPISYSDAQPLLAALTGPIAPQRWRGSLAQPYHVGNVPSGGPARVHLKVTSNWAIKTLYDVITRIPGSEFPDQYILRGNHHDGWVNGAEDPLSGQVAEMEELRAFSELLKQGWRPKRTIIYGSWDGEEPGLLGSTEWAETHGDELQKKAVMYINTDGNGRGYLGMSGSHTLERFINGVARDINDPEKNITAWKRAQARHIANVRSRRDEDEESTMTPAEERKEARTRPDLRISALGSGSDYTPFLQHLGIASLNLGYGGEDGGGIYHSIYDDFYWYTHFADTEFVYGRALAQTVGTAIMRMADADLLPFEFTDFADTMALYLKQLKKLASDQKEQIAERRRELQDGVYEATSDPRRPLKPPKIDAEPPVLDFSAMDSAVQALNNAAQHYQHALDGWKTAPANRNAVAEVNALLMQSERRLISNDGLPNRPWYRHQIYAPGFYTGYGVKTVPMVRESIEQKQYELAQQGIARVAAIFNQEAQLIEQAASALEGKASPAQ
jgi:N-acetylated-alpha-linked acidic dipeptidase